MSALALSLDDLTDPARIGYPLLALGVFVGSVIPVVPTGAVVGAAAAVAMTTPHLSLPLVVLVATVAALAGDLITYGVARLGSDAAVRWVTRRQPVERLDAARATFARRGWQLVVVGRLLPAGRIPVLVAAAALAHPWRRLVPAAALAALLWAVAYSVLGVVSGGLFDSPLVATLVATVLVLLVGAVSGLVARRRRARVSGDRRARPTDSTGERSALVGATEPGPPHGRGRLLRGGRAAVRVVCVWAATAVALVMLDRLLPGFEMDSWWQPVVCALLLGLLTAIGWPPVARLVLPLALFTLGVGGFLLMGAGVAAVFLVVPGVHIHDFRAAVVVAVALAAVGAVISSLLALDEDEIFFRRAARRARRAAATDPDQVPGVLFLQVDGLGHDVVRRAVRDGDMPTLARWLAEGGHELTGWHCDWSSQTGASVCGILHGDNTDILGFRWYEKDRDHVMACAHPGDAAEIERRHSDGRGLLAVDGAARGNLFTGDAEHVSLTMSAIPLVEKRRRRGRGHERLWAGYYTYFANPVNALRTFVASLVDVGRELLAAARQRRADVRPRTRRGGWYPLARPGTTVISRDIVVSAIIEDMMAGRSVVYADFLGYDEVAHHSGIERFDTLEVLRGIDRQIGRLHRATHLAPRPYRIVVLTDHGQTQGWAFADRFGESIEQFVGRQCGAPQGEPSNRHDSRRPAEGWQAGAVLAEATSGTGPIARRLRARVERAGTAEHRTRTESGRPGAVARAAPGVVVVASGHVAMVSFTEHDGRVELETIEREFPALLPALVDHPGVGFVLVRSREYGAVVLGRDGARRLATDAVEGADPLTAYGPHAADLVRRVDGFPHCADIMINSRYEPGTDDAPPFEPHVGSHGGLGGPQSRGFLLYPADLPAPGEIVGAEALHRVLRGWLTHLGHPEPAAASATTHPDSERTALSRN
ncbi:phage holin family protein [Pseudonocardia sp. D17]|uniref:phage holin family protein n=1 Tax=Pseudonocardia sp. D17 TaxID=882661 RepID=UPI002B36793B|nr:hypothetical protein PSD17_04690 [Pseudonocardia sp. D17]